MREMEVAKQEKEFEIKEQGLRGERSELIQKVGALEKELEFWKRSEKKDEEVEKFARERELLELELEKLEEGLK